MQTHKLYKLGMAALMTIVLAACSSTGSDNGDQDMDSSTSAENGGSSATTQGANTPSAPSSAELEAQRMLAMTVFYFDFDRSDLKPEAREALVYHANQLKANSGMSIRLEGHADERGTREYNLALGERRAQAVERYLLVQGVSSSQMETISFGEEMPVTSGNTEAAYSRNRRVELVY